jgi:hypothetical protein
VPVPQTFFPNRSQSFRCDPNTDVCTLGISSPFVVSALNAPAPGTVSKLNNFINYQHFDDWTFSNTGWQQIGAAQGNVATEVANFTVTGTQNQNPWIVANGKAYAYNGSYFVQVPNPTYLGLSYQVAHITDRYILDQYGNAWRWTGDAYGNPGSPAWKPYLTRPANVSLVKIAAAEQVLGSAQGNIGPSGIYALDSNNNIYNVIDTGTAPPPK